MSEPYGNNNDFTTYCADRRYAIPESANDSDKNSARLIASEYLDSYYRESFPGLKTGLRAQIREWPRSGVWDDDGYPIEQTEIPREIVAATYELAWRQLTAPGTLSVDFTQAEALKSVSIEGAISVEYAGVSGYQDAQPVFPIVNAILAPILCKHGGSGLSGPSRRV